MPGEVLNAYLKVCQRINLQATMGSQENFTFNSITLSKMFLFCQSATLTK